MLASALAPIVTQAEGMDRRRCIGSSRVFAWVQQEVQRYAGTSSISSIMRVWPSLVPRWRRRTTPGARCWRRYASRNVSCRRHGVGAGDSEGADRVHERAHR